MAGTSTLDPDNIPRKPGRNRKPHDESHLGPSDSSDTPSDRPNDAETDSDMGGTGERVTTGVEPEAELHDERATDRVVGANEAGLGGGLDEGEEALLGMTDEEIEHIAEEDAADAAAEDDEDEPRAEGAPRKPAKP